MTTATTISFQAFGYEQELSDSYTAEEIDILENAPVLVMLSGTDEAIGQVESTLGDDQYIYWTEAGEAILFQYEDVSEAQELLLATLDIRYEVEDRSEA